MTLRHSRNVLAHSAEMIGVPVDEIAELMMQLGGKVLHDNSRTA
jgi:hypothetical protein